MFPIAMPTLYSGLATLLQKSRPEKGWRKITVGLRTQTPTRHFRIERRVIRHIHIITLQDGKLSRNYVLGQMAECWQTQGIKVTAGPTERLHADIGILHVDTTRVPAGCLPDNPLGRPILNARVLDISKRRISDNILSRDSDYAGPVVIKTDANCFGTREAKQLSFWNPRRLRRKLTKILPWQAAGELPRSVYPILDGIAEVPDWVWRREDLVVERFLPEVEDGEYVLRSWLFLGNQDYVVKVYCPDPIVKAHRASHHEYLDSVPDSLRARRAQLDIDFGKFDYVMVNGEAVLLDANKTPATTASDTPSENIVRVATGIMHFASAAE